MDNLSGHKDKAVRRSIRSAGAKLFFLPEFLPDLNPIEQVSPGCLEARLKPPMGELVGVVLEAAL